MVAFTQLWRNHPTITGNTVPCSTKKEIYYSNQCTIRMGVCLQNSGIDTTRIPNVVRCPYHKKQAGHILRVEELANALKNYAHLFPGVGKMEEIDPVNFKMTLVKKKGIIFLKDYYRRSLPSGRKELSRDRSGDHIDLWNGLQFTDPKSLIRIQRHIVDENNSDLELSKAIWFWEIY